MRVIDIHPHLIEREHFRDPDQLSIAAFVDPTRLNRLTDLWYTMAEVIHLEGPQDAHEALCADAGLQ